MARAIRWSSFIGRTTRATSATSSKGEIALQPMQTHSRACRFRRPPLGFNNFHQPVGNHSATLPAFRTACGTSRGGILTRPAPDGANGVCGGKSCAVICDF
jgi:hypothetical protein